MLGTTLTMTWELGARAGLGVNASYTRPTEGDARTGEFNGSVAIGVGVGVSRRF